MMPALKPLRTLREISSPHGMRILVRASLNVPLKEGGDIRSDFRITRALETLRYLKERDARVVVLAHIGRDLADSLAPVADILAERLGVHFAHGLLGDETRTAVERLGAGEILLLENVRSDPRETMGDESLARELASFGEAFINDAFAASHRQHASIVGIPQYLPSYAGLLFAEEYDALSTALAPEAPSLFVLGGAKAETKLPLLEAALERYGHVFVGGALANDFFKARGLEVGTSRVSELPEAPAGLFADERVLLPEDVVVDGPSGRRVVAADGVAAEESILDVGPQTLQALAPHIAAAKTIIWNGPLGHYERGFTEGTDALAVLIADSAGRSIVGGGDTVAALRALGRDTDVDFLSTAGGAMLTFLETGTLPGIEALRASS